MFSGTISLLEIGSLFKTVWRNGLAEAKYDIGEIKKLDCRSLASGGISGAIAMSPATTPHLNQLETWMRIPKNAAMSSALAFKS